MIFHYICIVKKTIYTFIFLALGLLSYSQEEGNWKLFPGKKDSTEFEDDEKDVAFKTLNSIDNNRVGYLEVVQDERIKKLQAKNNKINEESMSIPGFRVQLFSGSGAGVQAEANKIKADFIKLYEKVPAHVDYDAPIWKTRVGDFRTQLEAEKFLLEIQENFPNSFVVKDNIKMPDICK